MKANTKNEIKTPFFQKGFCREAWFVANLIYNSSCFFTFTESSPKKATGRFLDSLCLLTNAENVDTQFPMK